MRTLFLILSLLSTCALAQTLSPGGYVIFFSYDGEPDMPRLSHTWGSFLEVDESGHVSARTISWLPKTGIVHPLIFQEGKNFDLKETYVNYGSVPPDIQGPFRVAGDYKAIFARADARIKDLESHEILYKMTDWMWRDRALLLPPSGALNCQHALSDVFGFWEAPVPTWGKKATLQIIQNFSSLFEGSNELTAHPDVWNALAGRPF